MIAALLFSAALAAAAPVQTAPPAAPAPAAVQPPAGRATVEAQFAAPRPAEPGGLSGVEADRLFALYLSRIGQAQPSSGQQGGASSGGANSSR